MTDRKLELLSPAQNALTAREAILHGADAVYIGPPSHGARKAASNSLDDIASVVDFAHQFRSKVYLTVNTIVYENELKKVETLCRELYHIGVDALIVQDMGILRMKLPPISLHASTQCDIRTPEKAEFLEKVGFSQLVLARELTLPEIREIAASIHIPVECFVHGALCVSYSGRCHASLALTGRSANRGECAQICRYPFTLTDAAGKVLSRDKHLLSLKDFNASANLFEMIDAGVTSFKIEGRLKDMAYVKNVTAFYNNRLNELIKNRFPDFKRSSCGQTSIKFKPDLNKSFNRGFTNYFLKTKTPSQIASLLTPKSLGEPIYDVKTLNNGDGISFFDSKGNFTGTLVNGVKNERIIPSSRIEIPEATRIFRTHDVKWDKNMQADTAIRKIKVDITLTREGIWGEDERGVRAFVAFDRMPEKAEKVTDYKKVFEKLGNTIYELRNFTTKLTPSDFYPLSWMTGKRRELVEKLNNENTVTYLFEGRRSEDLSAKYPADSLDFSDNVANSLSQKFYQDHGVVNIERAAEVSGKILEDGKVLMTTRHCILRELGKCKKSGHSEIKEPLFLNYRGGRFLLDFDCKKCEMQVLRKNN